MNQEQKGIFFAGAGSARFVIPDEIFPLEGFVREEDPVFVRTLLLAGEERIVLISMEIPSLRNEKLSGEIRKMAAEITGAGESNIWLCATHNLTTIHIPPEDREPEKHRILAARLKEAVARACRQAYLSLRPARLGTGTGCCHINTNRDIESRQGWWNGIHGQGESDHLLTVFRFEDWKGNPIAFVYHYPVKSCTMQEAEGPRGERIATNEICGECSRRIEEAEGAPALFFMGAAADMVPRIYANYCSVDERGDLTPHPMGLEEGLRIKNELAGELAEAILSVLSGIHCGDGVFLHAETHTLFYPGQEFYNLGRPYHPTPDYVYRPAGEQELSVSLLCLNDTVLIGMPPETTAAIGIRLRERTSPVRSLVAGLVNGGKDYLADELSYDRFTFCGTHSVFARGGGERFVEDAAALIRRIYEKEEKSV